MMSDRNGNVPKNMEVEVLQTRTNSVKQAVSAASVDLFRLDLELSRLQNPQDLISPLGDGSLRAFLMGV
jgi:hypothetical protein